MNFRQRSTPAERLRLGFVGGGLDSGIGSTHRYAATLDGQFEIVAGVFSRDAARNAAAGAAIGIAPDRLYGDFETMARAEAARADGIHAVAIATPNAQHVPAALAFLAAGIDVICDKPLATDLAEARRLAAALRPDGPGFVLTHNYSGHAMVREARERVAAGEIGAVRVVQVEHAAGFGTHPLERAGAKALAWRTDPAQAGVSSVLLDVGTHAHQLARYITGLEVAEVAADVNTLVEGRGSDDNAHALLRFDSGARGSLWASIVAAGNRHGLKISVYGSKAALHWNQEQPEELVIAPQDGPRVVVRRGEPWTSDAAKRATRIKAGQAEGVLEAFANIYSDAAELIRARRFGTEASDHARRVPGAADGVKGLAFVEACVRSARAGGGWTAVAQ
ncbi:Gfo/Idh/MocA family protein [Derxia gummosa]|uniref:Gfo/Idh/MocA family protein n=1 Tax=Derxia gummosa DSM 723 TaxID=1121388 RepID=A0A8B6X3Y0_9BURK|nr:Gfo/Idh/MocA family oxidoreductase [Derxia gummosa]